MLKMFLAGVAVLSLSSIAHAEFKFSCKANDKAACLASFEKQTQDGESTSALCNVSDATTQCKDQHTGYFMCKVKGYSACSELSEDIGPHAERTCAKNVQAQVVNVKVKVKRYMLGESVKVVDATEPAFCIVANTDNRAGSRHANGSAD